MYSLRFRRTPRFLEKRSERRALCLVVDDDAVCRTVVQSQLRTLGLDAIGAATADEAMSQIRRRGPSSALIDRCLQQGDGYGLARRIRHYERGRAAGAAAAPLVLVALSGYHDGRHVGRCLAAGMNAVLAKPAALPDLAACLGLRMMPPVPAPWIGPIPGIQELYRACCLRDLRALRIAVREQDWVKMRSHAHRIRGASQVVGADAVAGMAAMLERIDGDREADVRARDEALRWMHHIFEPVECRN
jgi:CheY-like chemotaxis protein